MIEGLYGGGAEAEEELGLGLLRSSRWGGERSDGFIEKEDSKDSELGVETEGMDKRERRKKKYLGQVALGAETREEPMCKRMPRRQALQTICPFFDKNYLDLVG